MITQSLFQSKGAGDGFRRFRIGTGGAYLGVDRVDDMVRFQPFDGAANWTSVVFIQKGRKTEYPIPYWRWRLKDRLPEPEDESWRDLFELEECEAAPVDSKYSNSPWAIKSTVASIDVANAIGKSDYKGHAGAYSGGANGAYWIRILESSHHGLLVENIAEKSKKPVPRITRRIEAELVYPLLRWLDVKRFRAQPTAYILVTQDPQTRRGIAERTMKKLPKTYEYLLEFESVLRSRGSSSIRRLMDDGPFYSMYAVGPYTMAPVKVVWRRMDRQINAAVVTEINDPHLGVRAVIPQETCVLVACESLPEAHYLCAIMNSSLVNFVVRSHSVHGGKGFGTPSMLDHLRIRRFDPNNTAHARISGLGEAASMATASDQPLGAIMTEINEATLEVFGIDIGGASDLLDAVAAQE